MSQEDKVLFWVSREEGVCRWNAEPYGLPDTRIISNGGVCAYQQNLDFTLACPAPDLQCWGWRENCLGSNANGTLIPGSNQRICTNPLAETEDDQIWCCPEETLCPTKSTSWNICVSNWDSPVADLNSADAYALMSSVLGTTTIGTSTVLSKAPIFSTLTVTSGDQTSVSTTSSIASPTSQTRSQTSETNVNAEYGNSGRSSGISVGALAGIVIGIVVVLLVVVGVFFYRRRKSRRTAKISNSMAPEPPNQLDSQARIFHEKGSGISHAAEEKIVRTEPSEIMTRTKMTRSELP